MIDDKNDLSLILMDTPLAGRDIMELPVLDTGETVFSIQITQTEAESCFTAARALLDRTGRWPLITNVSISQSFDFTSFSEDTSQSFSEAVESIQASCHTGTSGLMSAINKLAKVLEPLTQKLAQHNTKEEMGDSLQHQLIEEDLFSRFYFEEAPQFEDNPVPAIISPKAIISRADTADYQQAFCQYTEQTTDYVPLGEYISSYDGIRVTARPSEKEIAAVERSGKLTTNSDNERWIDAWEQQHGYVTDIENSRQPWYEPDHGATLLLFLPTAHSWDALAYINWFGTSDIGTEYYIALGRSWEKRFGAELVAHHGTILHCIVHHPPKTLEEAWQLACEHDQAAGCTLGLPMIALRDYAHALIGWKRWFLHERP